MKNELNENAKDLRDPSSEEVTEKHADKNKIEETPVNSYERQIKHRRRQRRVKTIITIIVLALLGAGGYQLYLYLQKMNTKTEESASSTSYRVQMATEGSITSTVSYSGSMTPKATETEYPVYDDSTVGSIDVALSGTFKKGDTLMVLELDDENELVESMDDLIDSINSTDRVADSKYLRASAKGYIKDIKFYEGCDITDIMNQYGYIALICLDNRMQLYVETDQLAQYEKVDLKIGVKTYSAVVQEVKGGKANILLESSKPEVGAEAEVYKKDGTLVGTGTMELVSYSEVTAVDGYITTVNVKDGQLVRRNDKIALCRDLPTNTEYQELIDQKEDLQQEIDDATIITAPFDGRVLEINVAQGDTVDTETALLTIQSLEGYTISLSVDELDIATLKMGQKAAVELDALDGEFEGEVSYISYVNSSSGNTVRYTVEVSVEDIPGALPDMSATCTIVTADSGAGIIIPADALQRADRQTVVYKAPEGARFAMSYKESDIDLAMLTKVEVEVIQSDGNNILVKGDLNKEDLILTVTKTTSATYSSSSSSTQQGGFDFSSFGGMPGGGNFGGSMPSGNFGGMPDGGSGNRGGGSGNNRSSGSNSRGGSSRGN